MQESFDSWLAKVNYIDKSLFDEKGFNNNNPFFSVIHSDKKLNITSKYLTKLFITFEKEDAHYKRALLLLITKI